MIFSIICAIASSSLVLGAPAPKLNKRQESIIVGLPNGPQINNADLPYSAVGPVGASGDPFGSPSFAGSTGDNSPPTEVGPNVPYPSGSVSNYVGDYELVPCQEADPDLGLYLDFTSNPNPQPIRAQLGGVDSGPKNEALQRQNSDLFARPGTDAGDVPNAKWPMALSSNRLGTGSGRAGWARQQNTNELPVAIAIAGVDMALAPNAYRELHWHSLNEWAYIFTGGARIATVNQNGQSFVDDLRAGDLWYVQE
jgi:hypothetical protein